VRSKLRAAKPTLPNATGLDLRPAGHVIYRQATVADAAPLSAAAARFFADSYHHVMAPAELQGHLTDFFTTDKQYAELTDPCCATFLALDDAIVGYAQLVEDNVPACGIDARKPAELKRIYVDRNWHGKGIAQELLQLVQREAQQRACDRLWLAVWEINDRAISFYSKNGFQTIGRQGFPIGSDDQSDFVMAKPLANELR
jgi:ribosomal protein S18 acetylase RimI-like enzyme